MLKLILTGHGCRRKRDGLRQGDSKAGWGFPGLVQRRRPEGAASGQFSGCRHHDRSPLWLCLMGKHSRSSRPSHQANRARELVLPGTDSAQFSPKGEGPRRGLRPGISTRHQRWRQGPRGTAGLAADLGDDDCDRPARLRSVLSGPTSAHQPMEQRLSLGAETPLLLAHSRVPLARGSYRPRHATRGRGRGQADAGGISDRR